MAKRPFELHWSHGYSLIFSSSFPKYGIKITCARHELPCRIPIDRQAVRLYKCAPNISILHHPFQDHPPFHIFPTSTIEAIDTLQLLHQLNVVLLGSRRGDLILLSDLLPRIILILLLFSIPYISRYTLIKAQACRRHQEGRKERTVPTNLEGEGARLCGLGEVFAGALLVICVKLSV